MNNLKMTKQVTKKIKSPKQILNRSDCTCPVCLDLIIDPVLLTCHHELCLQCFSGIQIKGSNPCCPICRGLLILKNAPLFCPVCGDHFFHAYCNKTHRRIPKKYLINAPKSKLIKRTFRDEIRERKKEFKKAKNK